jgi:hypothetical protein
MTNQNQPTTDNDNCADSTTKQIHRIMVSPEFRKDGRYGCEKAGQCFISRYEEEIICTSTQPLLDSARILRARGFIGHLEMWHEGMNYACMTMPLGSAAVLTTEEGERIPSFVEYVPFQGPARVGPATTVALTLKKAAGELTAVQGIEPGTVISPVSFLGDGTISALQLAQ